MQITFIRHAETEGNVAHVWQGHGDSPLTERGRRQAADLGARPSLRRFDLVVASDLGRVRETAAIAGLDPELDPQWREVHLGGWEGLTSDEIEARHPDERAALRAGADVPLGGGETPSALAARIDAAFDALVARCDDGDRVAVITHGGVIHSIVARHLGLRGRDHRVGRLRNTAMTTFEVDGGRVLAVFNDATHTGTALHPDESGAIVALVRHGETEANVDGRWQGVTDGALTEEGRAQARRLAAAYDGLDHVYSSHLQRARDTAAALAGASGVEVTVVPGLQELHFGEWEDLAPARIREIDAERFEAIYVHDQDLPRGGTGETAAAMGRRMADAVAGIARRHPGGHVAAVSHGGAIRALASDLVGLPFDNRSHLALAGNTEVTHVRAAADGLALASYNTRPGR
ncbi:MAG: histidine phosphatase family protein [Actinobacteria bacterium]|nr:histidine phosphatase family protein [Actinomycetota bacterium]